MVSSRFAGRGLLVSPAGVALAAAAAYDRGMIIDNLASVCDWCAREMAECGALDSLEPAAAARAVEDAAGVIWRHAFGQGLKPRDDWGWILEMYGPDRLRMIAAESVESHKPQQRRR